MEALPFCPLGCIHPYPCQHLESDAAAPPLISWPPYRESANLTFVVQSITQAARRTPTTVAPARSWLIPAPHHPLLGIFPQPTAGGQSRPCLCREDI